ncbi:cyanocobalamin reductase / alkylcobalamin dealkylase-like [Watersipora subatra]|uniref:cyanocobalamin reductase / alkylcobalamin dealkylase-like n=1 Tax=Watersipora subatra TaxID=2589382 RepID=UPI00355B4208
MEEALVQKVREAASPRGFDVHFFKVGWYNELVDESFHLPYDHDALALLLLSNPDMFELSFIPFLRSSAYEPTKNDPLDQFIKHYVSHLRETVLRERDIEVYYDYEMDPRTRRPRIIMQTAGHAAGAAFYYHQGLISHLLPENSTHAKKLFPVSIHPEYGGWFAFRAVIVLRDIRLPEELTLTQPIDCVPRDEDRLQLLQLFNGQWQDGLYRDINKPKKRYSSIQKEYFITPPKSRSSIIEKIINTSM